MTGSDSYINPYADHDRMDAQLYAYAAIPKTDVIDHDLTPSEMLRRYRQAEWIEFMQVATYRFQALHASAYDTQRHIHRFLYPDQWQNKEPRPVPVDTDTLIAETKKFVLESLSAPPLQHLHISAYSIPGTPRYNEKKAAALVSDILNDYYRRTS